MRAWLRQNKFPLLLALSLVAIQIIVFIVLATGGKPGQVWTGTAYQNADDQAVYIGYVEQVRRGAYGLQNLYAPLPQKQFWHPLYILIGLFARLTGFSSVTSLWIFLWLATALAVFFLHAVSRAVTKNERDASMATLLITITGGLGWITLLALIKNPAWGLGPVPDANTEAFFFPTMFMGPHIPLSLGLLPYTLLSIWKTATSVVSRKRHWIGIGTAFALTLVHPYAVPTLGLFMVVSLIANARISFWQSVRPYLGYGVAMLIGTLPHLYGQCTNWDAQRLLMQNALPLSPVWFWWLAFAPYLAFVAARFIKKIAIKPEETWIMLWLGASVVVIALPFHWDRKVTEGWHAALIWLALPVLIIIRERICRVWIMTVACVATLAICPLFTLGKEIPLFYGKQIETMPFYIGNSELNAWQWVSNNTPSNSRVLPSSAFAGLWSAPFMQRSVWIGHPFETPDYEKKLEQLSKIPTQSPADLIAFLEQEKINVIFTSDQQQTSLLKKLSGTTWHQAAQFDSVTILER